MSAWIVSENHINALVTFAVNNDLVIKHNNQEYRIADNPDRVGQELWAENFRSVNYRYNESMSIPNYKFKEYKTDNITLFKNIKCYDYQTCECDNYNETFAKVFVTTVEDILSELGYTWKKCENLIEFENAPWGID